MVDGARSLNLSNSAAILTYEALRQAGFPGLAILNGGEGRHDALIAGNLIGLAAKSALVWNP